MGSQTGDEISGFAGFFAEGWALCFLASEEVQDGYKGNAEVTQRLSNPKAAVRVVAMPSHVDLAKNLQEEMDKKWKTSTGHTSQGSRRMREVACPTCTVYLQVEVPAFGSETIECSVCQHPFLVSAH